MKKKFEVAIIHNSTFLRVGLKMLMSKLDDIDVVFDADSLHHVISELKKCSIDVILLDIEMIKRNSLTSTLYIREHYPNIRIILLKKSIKKNFNEYLYNSYGNGYRQKNNDIDDVVDVIKGLSENNGLSYLTDEETYRHQSSEIDSEAVTLSERELEIVKLISKEFTSKEIANKLCVSIRTIEGHKERIMEKTKSKNTVGIVMYAAKFRLLEI